MTYIFETLLLCGGKFIKTGTTKNIIYYNVEFIHNYNLRSQFFITMKRLLVFIFGGSTICMYVDCRG